MGLECILWYHDIFIPLCFVDPWIKSYPNPLRTKGLNVQPMHSFTVLAKSSKQNIYELETLFNTRSCFKERIQNLTLEIDGPIVMHAFATKDTPY